jgi:hypothetical protein
LICSCGNVDFTQELKVKSGVQQNRRGNPTQVHSIIATNLITSPTTNMNEHGQAIRFNPLEQVKQNTVQSSNSNTPLTKHPAIATTLTTNTALSLKADKTTKKKQPAAPCQQGAFKCDGQRIGIWNFNQFVWTTCPTDILYQSQGNAYYCG